MRNGLARCTTVMLLTVGSVACITGHAAAQAVASPHEPVPGMRLVMDVQPPPPGMANAPEALDSPDDVTDLLDALEAPLAENLQGRINMLLNNPSRKLRGLGGIQARAALRTAEVTLGNAGNYQGPITSFNVTGQIPDEVEGETGFYYKPGQRAMHMWVEMITTATRTLPNGKEKTNSWAEMFRVEIPTNAVAVEYKSGTDDDVFPGFGAAAFPVPAEMAIDFDWKLWAVGDEVQVTDYWIDRNVQPGTDPSYPPGQRYTAANVPASLANIFQSGPADCIDMMFAKNPAAAQGGALDNGELPADAEPPFYCLGRCQSPPVVNTR